VKAIVKLRLDWAKWKKRGWIIQQLLNVILDVKLQTYSTKTPNWCSNLANALLISDVRLVCLGDKLILPISVN